VRRLTAILVVACLGLWLPGCSLFKKNTGGGDSSPSSLPPPKFPTADSKDPLTGQRGAGGNTLAGRAVDGNSRPPENTSIRIVSADAKDDDTGEEVRVSPEGYFVVENLKQGGHYKLIARGKQGNRAVAGTVFAKAPNIRLLIPMSEDFVSSTTPGVQEPYSSLDDRKPEPLAPQKTVATAPTSAWQPTRATESSADLEATLPVQIAVRPDGFMQSGAVVVPPPLSIDAKPSVPVKATPPAAVAREEPVNLGPTKVPSCVREGNKITSFALYDMYNGERWDYKAGTDRKGKAVLIDFWKTGCPPCLPTMEILGKLQKKYGGESFEVVGIACENAGDTLTQAHRVKAVCDKHGGNSYVQLRGGGDGGIVASSMGVRGFPTLVLLNAQGRLEWYHVGELDANGEEELARRIRALTRS
jgi:thiol-disulfide isomerase/thioredoxin